MNHETSKTEHTQEMRESHKQTGTPSTEPIDKDKRKEEQKSVSNMKRFFSSKKGKILLAIAAAIVLLGLATKEVYSRPVTDDFVRVVSRIIPYPALSVNDSVVTIREFLIEYDALLSYFGGIDGASAPPDGQLESAIAETLINKTAIKQLAAQYGVEIDDDLVESYYQDVVSSQESIEAFEAELTETFGWDVDEFKERIIESIVLALQMSDFVLADENNEQFQTERFEVMTSAYSRISIGEDFATVAKEINVLYGEGFETDLGYVNISIIPEGWREAVEMLEINEFSKIIELPEGYAAFLIVDRIDAGEDTQLHLITLTVPKQTLEDLVATYLEMAEVKQYVGL